MHNIRLISAVRALLKDKVYAFLNILGLAIGLAVSIVIFLYLQSELDYDTSVINYRNIYRIESQFQLNGEEEKFAGTSLALAPMLSREYDYINDYTRLYHIDVNVLFKYGDISFYEDNIAVADSHFFEVFEIPFIRGDAASSLEEPYTMVITRSFSKRYFGNIDPVGKVISTNNHDYTITGLIEDRPANTHHKFDAVLSAFYDPVSLEDQIKSLWNVSNYTFIKLDGPGVAGKLLNDFNAFYDKYMQPVGKNLSGQYEINLTRLDKIHFGEELQYDKPHGDKTYLYAFGAIGLLILMLACINYVNMATAKGLRRVKEAGIRKILGSGKWSIRAMIFTESLILSILSLFLSFVLVELVLELTPFNEVLQKDLALNFNRFPALWWFPLCLALLMGIISGLYPAYSHSKIPALAAIQGGYKSGRNGLIMRKALVGFQFCISVSVVIIALLMYRQMDYVRNKDLGFNKEDVLLISIQDSIMAEKIPMLHQKLEKADHVLASSMAMSVPGENVERTLLSLESSTPGIYHKNVVDIMHAGFNYLKTMQIKVVHGRDFLPKDRRSEIKAVLVNQELLREMGWKHPVGKIIKWGYDEEGHELYAARVIGVVQNFNSHSLHRPIEPTVIFLQTENRGTMHIRVDSQNLLAAMDNVEKIWSRADPKNPFQFSFLNKNLMNMYKEEQRQSMLILYLTCIAIFISFLGLTGLASFTTGLRTREIGIRKIMGADVFQLVNLIFRDILRVILVSVLFAIPLSYAFIRGWLSGFAYAAQLDPFIFVFSAIIAVLLAYLVVTYHSIKAARSNPVDTLKYE